MLEFLWIVMIGFFVGFIGFLPGIMRHFRNKKAPEKVMDIGTGFSAGMIVAILCFGLLPVSFESIGLYVGTFAAIAGVLLICFMDNKPGVSLLQPKILFVNLFCAGTVIGLVLSMGYRWSPVVTGLMAVHCFFSFGCGRDMMKSFDRSFIFEILLFLLFPVPLGAIFSVLMIVFLPAFTGLWVAFAGGILMYTVCGEILPASKNISIVLLSALFSLIGFAGGVAFIVL